MHDGMWGYAPMGWGGLMMVLASLFWLALLVLIVVVIVRLWPASDSFQSSAPREDEALSILKQRYARGEIDHEEFERMRRDLRS